MGYDFKNLKSQLIKGKISNTLEVLKDIAANKLLDKKIEKELSVLQFRWEKLESEERQNVISYENASLTKNQITSSILGLMDTIEQRLQKGPAEELQKKKNWIKYLLGTVIVGIIGTVGYFNFFKGEEGFDDNLYMDCPFRDTIPNNILIMPFKNYNSDVIFVDNIESALANGLSTTLDNNGVNAQVRIHKEKVEGLNLDKARNLLRSCYANLLIWGTYEKNDSIELTIRYVIDNRISDLMDDQVLTIEDKVKSVSSLERGDFMSKFEDIYSIATPILTGINLIREGQVDKAIELLDNIQIKNTKVANLVAKSKGDAFLMKKDYDKAIDNYKEAVKQDENNAEPYNNIGYALYKKGEIEEALENFKKAAEIDPENTDILENFEKLDEEFKNMAPDPVKKATIAEEKPTDENLEPIVPPDDTPTICHSYVDCNKKGLSAIDAGNNSDAIEFFKAAIKFDDKRATPYINIGQFLFHTQKDYPGAILNYKKATEIEPDFPNSYWHLYECYTEMGDTEKANEFYTVFQSLGGKLVAKRAN